MLNSLEWGLEHNQESLFRRVFTNEPEGNAPFPPNRHDNDFSGLLSMRNQGIVTQRELLESGNFGSIWGADIHRSPTYSSEHVVDWEEMEVIQAQMSCNMIELVAHREPADIVRHFRDEIGGAEDRRLFETLLSDTDSTTVTSVSECDNPVIGIEDIQNAVNLANPTNNMMVLSPSTLHQVFGDSPFQSHNTFSNIPIHESPHCPSDAVYILNNNMGSRQQVGEPLMTWHEVGGDMRMYLNFSECWKIKVKGSDHRLIRRKRNRFEMLEMEENIEITLSRTEDLERFERLELDYPM